MVVLVMVVLLVKVVKVVVVVVVVVADSQSMAGWLRLLGARVCEGKSPLIECDGVGDGGGA